MQASLGRDSSCPLAQVVQSLLQPLDERRRLWLSPQRFAHDANVFEDIVQTHRLQGNDFRPRRDKSTNGLLDVLQADGADFALRLRDDDRRLQLIQ